MWFYFLIFALCFIGLLLYFMPFSTEIIIKKRNRDDDIALYTRTGYGLISLKIEITSLRIYFKNGRPMIEYRTELASPGARKLIARLNKIFSGSEILKMGEMYRINKGRFLPATNYLLDKVKIDKFLLKLGIGTGDAAETGLIYGMAWIAIGNILSFFRSILPAKQPVASVVPYFDSVRFTLDFNCIISLKLGHIINTGIRAIIAVISGRKKRPAKYNA